MKFCLLRKLRAVYFTHLDLGVDGFASSVSDAVLEVSDDVGEAALEHAGYLLHRSQTAAHCPTVPPLEVLTRRGFVDVRRRSCTSSWRSLSRPRHGQLTTAVPLGAPAGAGGILQIARLAAAARFNLGFTGVSA